MRTIEVAPESKSESRPVKPATRRRSSPLVALAILEPLVIVFAFLLLTVVMTWPLPRHAGSAVQDLGDPLYEIWTMRWAQHQIINDPSNLWNGNVGYPFERSFLFSEPRLSTSILAWPVQILTGNEVLAYNLMFLVSFALLGLGMALLVREITRSLGAGILSGIFAAFTPYRYGHLSHLNLLSYGWLLLGLWALARFGRTRSPVDALLAGLFLSIQVLASDTLAFMAAGTVALFIPFLFWGAWRQHHQTLITGLIPALGLPTLATLRMIDLRLGMNERYGFSRDLDTVREMSATLSSYISISPENAFWGDTLPVEYPNPLFPGGIVIIAAILGLILGARRWPRWTLFASLLAVSGFILSLGPETVIGGRTITLPYLFLYERVPGMTAMRDVARFGMVALIGVQILAGLGVAATWPQIRQRLPRAQTRWAGPVALVLLATLSLGELRASVSAVEVPRDPETTAVYEWLAEQPHGPVFEFPADGLWNGVGRSIRQIYHSTRHWQPIVAAYTSFLPEEHIELLIRIHGNTESPSRPTRDNIGLLQDLDIRYVLIHRSEEYDWERAVAEASRVPDLNFVGEFGNAFAYTLQPADRVPVEMTITPPEHAYASRDITMQITLMNRNQSSAMFSLDRTEPATVTWVDESNQVVSTEKIPLDLPIAVDPGATHFPLHLNAPSQAGLYRLQIDCCDDHFEPLNAEVNIEPITSQADGSAPVILQRVSWSRYEYAPGDIVDVTLHWDVRSTPETSYSVATQVLSDDNRVVAQIDSLPFGNRHPTIEWEPGSVITQVMSLTLPENTPPGRYRIMIALYDGRQPTLPRLPIELSNGQLVPEGIFGSLSIAEDGSR